MPDPNIIINSIAKQPRSLLALVGPTCTGKTALAIELAEKFKIPIINCDSRLIFAEMNIGTAKPSAQELDLVQHYLVNIRKPNQTYSAGDYRDDFDQVFKTLPEREGPRAIVVGGTGLYLRAALDNLSMPQVSRDEALREELEALSLEDLQAKLDQLDPQARTEVDFNNKVRLIRALEIVIKLGKPLAELRSKSIENRYDVAYFALNFHDRQKLYDLIDKRVLIMIEQGLVDEVQTLVDQYGVTDTMMSTIGYREIIKHLKGDISLDQAIADIQQKTRVYAKRQLTWFRQNPNIEWLFRD